MDRKLLLHVTLDIGTCKFCFAAKFTLMNVLIKTYFAITLFYLKQKKIFFKINWLKNWLNSVMHYFVNTDWMVMNLWHVVD